MVAMWVASFSPVVAGWQTDQLFFDDAVHATAGMSGQAPPSAAKVREGGAAFQSIYHFTVGSGRHRDTRIMTRPSYEHLIRHRRKQQTPEGGGLGDRAVHMARPRYPAGGGIRGMR